MKAATALQSSDGFQPLCVPTASSRRLALATHRTPRRFTRGRMPSLPEGRRIIIRLYTYAGSSNPLRYSLRMKASALGAFLALRLAASHSMRPPRRMGSTPTSMDSV